MTFVNLWDNFKLSGLFYMNSQKTQHGHSLPSNTVHTEKNARCVAESQNTALFGFCHNLIIL